MNRKKRYRIKKFRVFVALVLLTGIILLLFNLKNIVTHVKLKTLDYSNSTIKILKDIDIEIENYSKTLDNISNTKYFNKDNLKYYLDIKYNNNDDNFVENTMATLFLMPTKAQGLQQCLWAGKNLTYKLNAALT